MLKLISYLLYCLFLFGLYLVIRPAVEKLYISTRLNSRVNREYVRTNRRKNDKSIEYIMRLLNSSLGVSDYKYVIFFFIISIVLGLFGIILTLEILPIKFGLFTTIVMLFLPFILLKIRSQNIIVSTSREGDILVSELLNNYKICYYNIEEAILKTANELEDAPYSKKILFDLSKGLNTAATEDEIKELLDNFKLKFSTSWGNILSTNIYFACTSGIKITNSLQDLSNSMMKSRKVIEYSKRENHESILMLKFLAPTCYILTIVGSIKYFGFTIQRFIKYQFFSQTGLQWFLIICGFYLLGIIVSTFLNHRKMEI